MGNIPKSGFHKLTWDCGKQYFGNTHRKQLMKRFCFQNTYLFTNSFLQFKNILSPVMFYKPPWLTKVRTAEDLPSLLLVWWTVLWHLREGRASFSLVLRAVPVHMKGRSHSLWQFRTGRLSAPLAKFSSDQKVRGQCHCALLSLLERNSETAVQKGISGKVWLIYF